MVCLQCVYIYTYAFTTVCIFTCTGEAMERGLRECCRSIRIGKILIRHDPDTKEPRLYYAKFPADIDKLNILLLSPNLGMLY